MAKNVPFVEAKCFKVNFYHWFIPGAARTLQPLYRALAGKPRPKTLDWSEDMVESFEATKDALANATMLHHPVQGHQVREDVQVGKFSFDLEPEALRKQTLQKNQVSSQAFGTRGVT